MEMSMMSAIGCNNVREACIGGATSWLGVSASNSPSTCQLGHSNQCFHVRPSCIIRSHHQQLSTHLSVCSRIIGQQNALSSAAFKLRHLQDSFISHLPISTRPISRSTGRRPAVSVTCSLDAGSLVETLPLVLGVGVGLPCTVMECGDVIYRSTLPAGAPFQLTVGGVMLLLITGAYLWSTPGVAPGFWDMFVLAPLDILRRRKLTKADLVLGKKMGEGAYGSVYKAKYAKPPPGKENEVLVVKRANQFGAVEVWMNERVRRACPSSCADFVHGFLESSGRNKAAEFWLVWRFEGDSTLADLMMSKDFPYNMESAVLGSKGAKPPRGAARSKDLLLIRALMVQILTALNNLHAVGIVHRDIKPQNIIFSQGSGQLKIIDLGAATDLRVGINYAPKEFLLDPRYAAPEQYIMSTQTPSAPSPPVAAALSPVLWQMNLPDRFDIYSSGLIFLQMVFPSLRSDSGLIQFNRQLKRCNHNVLAWRDMMTKRASEDMLRGFALLDADGGHGWALLQSMLQFKGRQRISAGGALAHPFFHPGDLPLQQRLRLQLQRAAYADNSELTQAFLAFMARSEPTLGGFTERQLVDIQEKQRKLANKADAALQRNALASALRLRRKVARTITNTVDELRPNAPSKKVSWWNRWQS
eukprot:TRINITY_DN2790_c0_g1_i1.p1 TRINITY_DN2790_c0_g1~~TRINITY_DN2790_c0_g1_i1.p1  ORF type:complete len:643 (-),score=121.23 TRINITY_DN2790_c0_g1_i1:904-2832(-)